MPEARNTARGAAPRLGALLLAAFGLAGCEGNVLDPKGPVAAAESAILIDAAVIMAAIIVPTMVATLAFAWWYRPSNPRAVRRPDWAYSGRIELLVWSVPLLAILFLGGIAWFGSHALDPAVPIASDKKTVDVEVVSLDWKWLFIYPDRRVAAVNRLVVPAGTPVHFTLTSGAVWDSFFVPGLGSMIYTMRGMATQLNLMADAPGSFHGLSTHFSGDGFSDMNFQVEAVPPDRFDQWVADARGAGGALDEAAYAALAKQSTAEPPRTYGDVDAELFDRIVAGKVPPGPGPAPSITPKGGS